MTNTHPMPIAAIELVTMNAKPPDIAAMLPRVEKPANLATPKDTARAVAGTIKEGG